MLRNCYRKYYLVPRNSFCLSVSIALAVVVLGSPVKAVTQNYRLILTESPTTSITIGWELIAGCPDTQRIYYDTVDHGQDTSAYRFQMPVTASYFHQGIENYFSTLKDLQPSTRYYFVVAEDEGISDRFWFQSLSNNKNSWRAYWTSPDLHQSPGEWMKLNSRISEENLDFVLADGLAGLQTEKDWRQWLENWQVSVTANGRITPLLLVGNLTSDIQYLFNLSEKPVYTYPLSARTVLITISEKRKLKSRHLKNISSEAFVISYSEAPHPKLPKSFDINLISKSTQNHSIPNLFSFPYEEKMVELQWNNGHLSVRSDTGKKIWEVFSN